MPDGSVIKNILGELVVKDGKRNIKNEVVFITTDMDGGETLTISKDVIAISTGNSYTGSSCYQEIPDYKKEAVQKWMDEFYPLI